jgi:hypothetical protein
MGADPDNFFSRWSQRKTQVRTGQPVEADPERSPRASEELEQRALAEPETSPADASATVESGPPAEPPVPTLDDVAQLGKDSDFKPFVARNVPAEVRNAAVKKLFADPHFNVMDGLDIYIDDYSQPSPLPAALMAKMVGAQFLKLVDDPEQAPRPAEAPDHDPALPETATTTTTPERAEAPGDEPSGPDPEIAETEPTHDDHTDLQLQPDHAPERPGPGRSAG